MKTNRTKNLPVQPELKLNGNPANCKSPRLQFRGWTVAEQMGSTEKQEVGSRNQEVGAGSRSACFLFPASWLLLLGGFRHVFREPFDFALGAVADVLGVAEAVAFVGVDDELGFDALGA
jgi:hypothetical protein